MSPRPFESLPARAIANGRRLGGKVAHYYHAAGRWHPVGWRTLHDLVMDVASGLIELGHKKGDTVAILSETRREWIYCDLAALAIGGITVGVYPSLTGEQCHYILAHSEARFLVIEDGAQLAKIAPHLDALPRLEALVVLDPLVAAAASELGQDERAVLSLDELRQLGVRAAHDVEERVAAIGPEDAATFIYTSGTTGPPKGAMVTHGNVVAALEAFQAIELTESDFGLSFLPLAHAMQRAVDYNAIFRGLPCGAYGRGLRELPADLAELRPTVMAAVPRIFEKIYHSVHEHAARSSSSARRIFAWAVEIGRQVSRKRQRGEAIARSLAWQHAAADRLVFARLRERLGGRVRVFISGGAPIASEILEFFDAAGITILEGWGMTETFSAGTMNLPGRTRFGCIGQPLPGVELRLDEDGELLIRGPNVFAGYYKQEEETARSFTEDGFFRTGDIARVNADGYYHIVDRKKDLIITAGGKNIAPQNIENRLKSHPLVEQAVVIGDRRPYLVALVAPTLDARRTLGEDELSTRIAVAMREVNAELPRFEQVKRFRLLPRELTQEAGELTPTLKVKRKVIGERYAALIDGMYEEPLAVVEEAVAMASKN